MDFPLSSIRPAQRSKSAAAARDFCVGRRRLCWYRYGSFAIVDTYRGASALSQID
jgi:hypothetical protein